MAAASTTSLSKLPKMKSSDLSPDDLFMVTDVKQANGAKYVSKAMMYQTLSASVQKHAGPGIKRQVAAELKPEITDAVAQSVKPQLSAIVSAQVSACVPIQRWYDEGSDSQEPGFILSGGNSGQ